MSPVEIRILRIRSPDKTNNALTCRRLTFGNLARIVDVELCDAMHERRKPVTSNIRSFAIIASLLATGCATSTWEKPGGDVANKESDLQACRQGAHLAQAGDPSLAGRVRPSIAGDGLLAMQSSPEMDSERQMREFQATQNCMRDKGYQLKPAR